MRNLWLMIVTVGGLTVPVAAVAQSTVKISIVGTIPAQCDSQPFRVLVNNNVVYVTQYLRCNRPGRYVIRVGEQAKTEWTGTSASYRTIKKSLAAGAADFSIDASGGREESFLIEAKNPASARAIASALSTQVTIQ